MKLSVVIPVFCVESTLDRCVESVLAQDVDDMEVILVDDGSPDDCPRLCDEWAKRDSRISVIHKSNGGLSDARNAGLDVACGQYITFVDSDDWLLSNTLAPLIETIGDCDILEYSIEERLQQSCTLYGTGGTGKTPSGARHGFRGSRRAPYGGGNGRNRRRKGIRLYGRER